MDYEYFSLPAYNSRYNIILQLYIKWLKQGTNNPYKQVPRQEIWDAEICVEG